MISFKKFSKNLFMLVLFLSGSTLSSVTIAKINKNMVFEYATKNGETTGQTASFVEYFGKELQLIYGSGPTEKVTFEKEMAIAVILLNLMTNDDNNYALGNFCKKVNDAWGEATENVEQINPETEVKIWTKLPPGWNPLSISWKTSKITLETFFNDILQLEWRDIYMKSFEENILSDEKFIQEIKTHYLPIVKVLNQGGKLESISIFESLALWIPEKNEKKNSNEVKKFLSKIIEIDLNYELNSFLVGFKEFK